MEVRSDKSIYQVSYIGRHEQPVCESNYSPNIPAPTTPIAPKSNSRPTGPVNLPAAPVASAGPVDPADDEAVAVVEVGSEALAVPLDVAADPELLELSV